MAGFQGRHVWVIFRFPVTGCVYWCPKIYGRTRSECRLAKPVYICVLRWISMGELPMRSANVWVRWIPTCMIFGTLVVDIQTHCFYCISRLAAGRPQLNEYLPREAPSMLPLHTMKVPPSMMMLDEPLNIDGRWFGVKIEPMALDRPKLKGRRE